MSREVFVSGQINDLDNVRSVQNRLIEAGHHITHDWTRNETGDKLLAGQQAKFDNSDEAARRAELDLQGVLKSDAYILVTTNEKVGKGMYAELGAALAKQAFFKAGKIDKGVDIYAIGPRNHSSIFYFHDFVVPHKTIEEIIEELDANS